MRVACEGASPLALHFLSGKAEGCAAPRPDAFG